MQPALMSPSQQVMQLEPTRPCQQKLRTTPVALALSQIFSSQAKVAIARAISIASLSVCITALPVKTLASAYDYSSQLTIAQSTTAEQDNQDRIDDISWQQTRLPWVSLIQTGAAALLLVGLISAYLANRARNKILTSDIIVEDRWGKDLINSKELQPQLPEPVEALADPGKHPVGLSAAWTASEDAEFARLADQFIQNQARLPEEQEEEESERTHKLRNISLRLHECQYLDELLKTAVKEVRRALRADRVFFYQFNADWSGSVTAESVAPGWPSCLLIRVNDTYFSADNGVEQYKNGRVCVTDDVHKAGLADCHLQLLDQFATKSQIIAPVLKDNQLFSLMIVNQCDAPRTWQKHDIDLVVEVAKQAGFAIDQVTFLEQQELEAERSQLMTNISLRLRESHHLEELFNTAVKEARRAIKADRVVVYDVVPDKSEGTVIAESVAPGWPQTLKVKIVDPFFHQHYEKKYKNDYYISINNIYQDSRVTDSYRNLLEQFAVKASLATPIFKKDQLMGLVVAHQCDRPRDWQQHEIDLFMQIASQVGFAMEQVSLREQI